MPSSLNIFAVVLVLAGCSTPSQSTSEATEAAIPVTEPIPTTDKFAGLPPVKYMSPRRMILSVGSISKCGNPPEGKVFAGCVRDQLIVHMANPCDFQKEDFARILCHEMAHLNGWPKDHGP